MKQHQMPVLTEQQREEAIKFNIDVIAQCDRMLNAICHSDDRPKFEQHKLSAQITLAALTAEPHAWHRMPDQGFHLPMMLRKQDGPPALEGEFYPVYDVPPLPSLKPVERPAKCPAYRDVRGSTYPQGYDDGVRDSMALVRLAGYEVKE